MEKKLRTGFFIILDGIDGSGKGTIIEAWKEFLLSQNKTIFDLKKYWQENNKYPEIDEIKNYDFIFSCEPTYTGIGKIIREELIKNGTNYPEIIVTQAFSLDRIIYYKKIVLPLLKLNKNIIQDRGIATSLAYHPIHDPLSTIKSVSKLPGNKPAIKNLPNHLILMEIKTDEAQTRLGGRIDKQDNAIFEKNKLQEKINKNYHSQKFADIFKKGNTTIHWLNGNQKIDIMKEEGVNLLKNILNII